jgi:bacteriocin-like protein
MSDENIIKNKPAVEAASSTELTEKDLETVTGGDKASNPPVGESVSLNFTKVEFQYKAQSSEG